MSRTMNLFTKTVPPTGRSHNATVIFFHGMGDNGANFRDWVRSLLGQDMEFPHIKVLYPTAPIQPYTPIGGAPTNVWFDRKDLSIECEECQNSFNRIYAAVQKLISAETSQGIPPERIVVGGFSMGGSMAMHTGYHVKPDVAGVFALSSFLSRNSNVYGSLKNKTIENQREPLPQLYMFHGDKDSVVPYQWAEESFKNLSQFGVPGKFDVIPDVVHELNEKELVDVQDWIMKKLPPP